jgi:hypothetical protein
MEACASAHHWGRCFEAKRRWPVAFFHGVQDGPCEGVVSAECQRDRSMSEELPVMLREDLDAFFQVESIDGDRYQRSAGYRRVPLEWQ